MVSIFRNKSNKSSFILAWCFGLVCLELYSNVMSLQVSNCSTMRNRDQFKLKLVYRCTMGDMVSAEVTTQWKQHISVAVWFMFVWIYSTTWYMAWNNCIKGNIIFIGLIYCRIMWYIALHFHIEKMYKDKEVNKKVKDICFYQYVT